MGMFSFAEACFQWVPNAQARGRSFIGLWACLLLVSVTALARERYARWEKRAVQVQVYSYVLNIDSSSSTKKSQDKSYMMHHR